jgi:ATP-dependent RNA helicase SUPV3L1/SUV3
MARPDRGRHPEAPRHDGPRGPRPEGGAQRPEGGAHRPHGAPHHGEGGPPRDRPRNDRPRDDRRGPPDRSPREWRDPKTADADSPFAVLAGLFKKS